MNPESLRVGLVQMTSSDQRAYNLQIVKDLYSQAAASEADLVVFPENTIDFRIQSEAPLNAIEITGPEILSLEQLVNQRGVALMLTTAVGHAKTKAQNSTVFIRPQQKTEVVYTKIHLFDVQVEGVAPVSESQHFEHGRTPQIVEFKGWRLGLSICYDVRFAELYLKYAQAADVILVPSAFLVPTGQAHWHVLLRARAIECQSFVLAPAQSGEHRSGEAVRYTFGNSLAIDPWGEVLSELTKSPQVQVVELKRSIIDKVRKQIPMSFHRRLKA